MDDGHEALAEEPEHDEEAMPAPVPQPWDDGLPFRRDEFVRVISSCLKGLGYTNASKTLEDESGLRAESDDCTARMLACVSNGLWTEALDLLSAVQFSKPSFQAQARALLLRYRLVELVEDRHLDEALACLREDLAPLYTGHGGRGGEGGGDDPGILQPEQLHALATLLLAPTAASFRRLSATGKPWGATGSTAGAAREARAASRSKATAALQSLLADAGRAIQPGRLENLVSQALTLQTIRCTYHNSPADKFSLATDHSCELQMLPQVSTHVLEDHADEVWCCRFSNGGGMLATSSADAVLILWDLGGGGSHLRRSPVAHRRIQVRGGAPQDLAWSPDDRWLLTCGESPEVTRWDASTGAEARCYGGEHAEAITGVAWLRDGRGFISVGLDRKVVVWSMGGIVLACWNCNARITGVVVTSPPQPATPRPPCPPTDEGAAASAAASDQAWSNEKWPLTAADAGTARAGGHNAAVIGSGRGGAGLFASPLLPPSAQRRRQSSSSGNKGQQQRRRRHQERRQQDREAFSRSSLRRCRAWIICRQDTIQALDIEVSDYGEPPLPQPPSPPPPPVSHGIGANGMKGRGVCGIQNGGSAGRHAEADVKIEAGQEGERGGSSGSRQHRSGRGPGAGATGRGVSPRFTPRGKSGGSCLVEEGIRQHFDGDIISGISAPSDGSQHLLLHMDKARICSWSSSTRKAIKKYEGHHQDRFMVQAAVGGLSCNFVASGSEDSLVYLWHRKSGALIGSIPGHSGTVNAVHWNPARPGMLASVSDDQTVRIWEPSLPSQQQPLLPPQGAGDSVSTAAAAAAAVAGATGSLAGGGDDVGDRVEEQRRGTDGRFGIGGGGSLSSFLRNGSGGGRRQCEATGAWAGGGVVRVKSELCATENEEDEAAGVGGGGGGSGSESKGKGKSRRSSERGLKNVEVEEGWESRRWGYSLAHGLEGWDGGDCGDGCYDGGFSASIAALRW